MRLGTNYSQKKKGFQVKCETLVISGRGERIRTSDILLPKQARYQAALRPDTQKIERNVYHLE